MWEFEHQDEGEATVSRVWDLWADVTNWDRWNADIERIEIDGPFAIGTTITMTPRGEDPVALRIDELEEGRGFVDLAEFEGIRIRTSHRVDPLDGGRVRVTYRTEISGPAAETVGPQIGPAITADFPDTVAALLAAAR
jgi:hypothetical protein